jgi:hypothetical protein
LILNFLFQLGVVVSNAGIVVPSARMNIQTAKHSTIVAKRSHEKSARTFHVVEKYRAERIDRVRTAAQVRQTFSLNNNDVQKS